MTPRKMSNQKKQTSEAAVREIRRSIQASRLGVERGRPPRPPTAVLGVQADGTVREERAPELVVERAGQTGLSAGLAHVAAFFGSAEEPQALKVTLLFEGHRFLSQVGVS